MVVEQSFEILTVTQNQLQVYNQNWKGTFDKSLSNPPPQHLFLLEFFNFEESQMPKLFCCGFPTLYIESRKAAAFM